MRRQGKKRADEIMGRGRRAEGEVRVGERERGGWRRRRRGGLVRLRMEVVYMHARDECVCLFVCVWVSKIMTKN